jgi:hypothetical protein
MIDYLQLPLWTERLAWLRIPVDQSVRRAE